MFPFPPPPQPAPSEGAAATRGETAQGGKKTDAGGKKVRSGPLQPPPGVSGTVASLVISPDWFAAKEESKRERFWWSPGRYLQSSLEILI